MGIFKAFKGSVASTFLDQWKEIITAGEFHEHSLVVPGVLKTRDNGRGVNNPGSEGSYLQRFKDFCSREHSRCRF